jgi:anaerobic selenocysteine-containing dehydrogenase
MNGVVSPLRPQLIRKQGKLEPASWDEAMELIVNKSKEIIEKLTPHAIAFYVSQSSQSHPGTGMARNQNR